MAVIVAATVVVAVTVPAAAVAIAPPPLEAMCSTHSKTRSVSNLQAPAGGLKFDYTAA